jgi:excisionase family DNA binding protein
MPQEQEREQEKQSSLRQRTFYRPDEVAKILSLSPRTIYRMIYDGRLHGIKLGKSPWRISHQALTILLKNKGD